MTYQQLLAKSLRFIKDEKIKDIPEDVLSDYCQGFDLVTLNEVDWKLTARDGLVYLTFLNLKIDNQDALTESCLDAFKSIESDLFLDTDTPLEHLLNFALMTIPLLFFSEYDIDYIDEEYRIPKLESISQEEIKRYVYSSLANFKKTFNAKYFLNPRILEFLSEEADVYDSESEDELIDYVEEIESNEAYYEPIPDEEDCNKFDPNGFYCCTEENEVLYFTYENAWLSVYNEGVYLNYLMKQIYLIRMLSKEIGEEALQRMILLNSKIDMLNSKLTGDSTKSIITELYNIVDEPIKEYNSEVFQKDETDELLKFILSDEELLGSFSLNDLALILISFKPGTKYTKEDLINCLGSIKRIISSRTSINSKVKRIGVLSKKIRKYEK